MRDSDGREGRGDVDVGWKTGNGREEARDVASGDGSPDEVGHAEPDMIGGDDGPRDSDLGMLS